MYLRGAVANAQAGIAAPGTIDAWTSHLCSALLRVLAETLWLTVCDVHVQSITHFMCINAMCVLRTFASTFDDECTLSGLCSYVDVCFCMLV